MKKFDVIIIGSGIGGLSTAVFLSKVFNKRVLVLEQHFKLGGLTHEFKRVVNGIEYNWDVGLHYVGKMQKGEMARKLFDYVSDGKMEWKKMPHLFEVFKYPNYTFKVPSNRDEFLEKLIKEFPEEKDGLIQYFSDVKKISTWTLKKISPNFFPFWLNIWLRLSARSQNKIGLLTTKEYLDLRFNNDKLKALLASQWGNYALPPQKSSFATHGLVINSYLDGGFYPIGGSDTIAKTLIPSITKNGGDCLKNHSVSEIIIENNKAIGVKVDVKKGKNISQEIFNADIIISSAGAVDTFTKLLPNNTIHSKISEINDFPKEQSISTLYIGLKESPEKLGVKGENYWIYDSYDHDDIANDSEAILKGKIRSAYLSFPSLKNPKSKGHTAEISNIIPFDLFKKWKDEKWMNRGDDYLKFKEEITNSYIDLIVENIKGFKNIVAYTELSTPLSIRHFTQKNEGEMYGVPAIPRRLNLNWLKPKTEIKNLYLTGSDVASHGIIGALIGGLLTASVIGGKLGIFKIIYKIIKFSKNNIEQKLT